MKKNVMLLAFVLGIFLIVGIFVFIIIKLGDEQSIRSPLPDREYIDGLKQNAVVDIIKDYDDKEDVITILDKDFSELVEYKLIENTDQCLINCYATGTAKLYYEQKLFDSLKFKNIKGREINIKDYKIFVGRNVTLDKIIFDYKEVCEEMVADNGTTMQCYQEKIGNHTEERTEERWTEYKGEVLEAGHYKWRIEGIKGRNEDVDWIINVFDKELDDWDWWNGNWHKRKEINITGGSAVLNNFTILLNVTFDSDMQVDFDDLRFVNGSCALEQTDELKYEISSKIDSGSALVWVKIPLLVAGEMNTPICMYYHNVGASSGQDPPNTWDVYYTGVWHLEESDIPYIDSKGNYNFTNKSGTPVSAEGRLGKGVDFERDSAECLGAEIGSGAFNTQMPAGEGYLIEAWSKPETTPHASYLASSATTAVAEGWSLIQGHNSGWGYRIRGVGGLYPVINLPEPVDGEWYYYSLNYDGANWDLCMNATNNCQEDAEPDDIVASDELLALGCLGYLELGGPVDGVVDEFRISNGTIRSDAWVGRSYNNTKLDFFEFGDEDFEADVINPEINITFPINNTIWNNVNLNVNFTRNDTNLAYCWYSNDTYLANSTPDATCNNITSVIWIEGQHDVTVWANDSTGNENYSRVSFTISVNPNINITFPINNTNWSDVNLDINFTRSDANLKNCWYSNDTYSANSTPDATCNNITSIVWSEGQHNVTVWANDTFGNENYSRISFTIDTINPSINITYPFEFVGYKIKDTNLTINFTASDPHLDSCWGSFDGGTNNVSLTCTNQNITRNITSVNNDTFTLWANDSLGNIENLTRTWIYKIFEVQQTFSETTMVGSTETFVNNIFLGSGETITEVNFNYNDTDKSASYTSLGGGEYNLSSTFVIPAITTIANMSFHWRIDLTSEQINTSSKIQEVKSIAIDDCSAYTTIIFNYTLIDEENQNRITNTTANATVIELNIEIFDEAKTIPLLNFSQEYADINPVQVCLNVNLTNNTVYAVDSTVKYEAVNYSIEYYNIQNFLLRNSTIPQNINLFDLLSVDATEFQITFKDSNFVTIEDALVQISRQYIPEGLFKTVEIPKTDSNGQTIAHLVEKDVVYNIIVLKEGVVLGTFNNVIAFCEDVVVGSCFISLNALAVGEVSFDYDDDLELFYDFDYNKTSRILKFDFTTTDGSVKNVTLFSTKIDQLGNTSVCTGFLVSSSGSVFCPVPISVGNETIIVSIFVDGVLRMTNYIQAGIPFDIGDAGYFLMFFLVLSLALMMTQSKTGVIIGVIIGFVAGSLLSFIQGGLLGIGSSIIWLIIMGLILIYKLNSQRQT